MTHKYQERVLITGGSGFIGRFLIEELESRGFEVSSFDLTPCPVPLSGKTAIVDLQNANDVYNFVNEVDPDYVIHLAAYASMSATLEEMTKVNVAGTKNLIRSLSPRVKATLYTSTQLVVTMGDEPGEDGMHLNPYTPYGETKAEMERIIRAEAPNPWIILRPGNIWGPYHPSFANAMLKYIAKGVYMHPAGAPIYRSYCYVKNCAKQFADLMTAPEAHNRVFYVSEKPMDSGEWVDAFSNAFRGRRAWRVPIWFLRILGYCGNATRKLGIAAPVDSERVRRMITSYAVPTEPTFQIVSSPCESIETGVSETKAWLQEIWDKH